MSNRTILVEPEISANAASAVSRITFNAAGIVGFRDGYRIITGRTANAAVISVPTRHLAGIHAAVDGSMREKPAHAADLVAACNLAAVFAVGNSNWIITV